MPNIRRIKSKNGEILDIVSKVDTTLTEENIPADSKIVGERLTALDDKINNLSVEGKSSVVNANTHYDFPSVGSIDCIYIANKEKKTYQWNPETLVYEALNESSVEDIKIIHGGNADGNFN